MTVDTLKFTFDDVEQAAKEIFSDSVESFEEIKNRKWYKSLINAITFGGDDKKIVIKSIRSLADLQCLFIKVYRENYKDLHEDINLLNDGLSKTSDVVQRFYTNYVLKVSSQAEISSLSFEDQQILLLLLCSYKSTNENEDIFQEYRSNIAFCTSIQLPTSEFLPDQLMKINNPDVFYRCIMEMAVLDDVFESQSLPDDVFNSLDYLDISNVRKRAIRESVTKEKESFGKLYFLQKYTKQDSSDDYFQSILDLEVLESADENRRVDDTYDELVIEERNHSVARLENVGCKHTADFSTYVFDHHVILDEGVSAEFNNRIIYVKGKVEINGYFKVSNCEIYSDGKHSFCVKGKMECENVTFHTDYDDYDDGCDAQNDCYSFFTSIIVGEKESNIIINNCLFEDCYKTIKSWGSSIVIRHTELINCIYGINLEYFSGDATIQDISFFLEDSFIFGVRKRSLMEHTRYQEFKCIDLCRNSKTIALSGFKVGYLGNGPLKDKVRMNLEYAILDNCYFYNMFNGPNISARESIIDNSTFDNCCNVIMTLDKSTIKNSTFFSCGRIIRGAHSSNVDKCSFLDSINNTVMCIADENTISNCRFIGSKAGITPSDYSCNSLIYCYDHDNMIVSCKFEQLKVNSNADSLDYIIGFSGLGYDENKKVAFVENCEFNNVMPEKMHILSPYCRPEVEIFGWKNNKQNGIPF